MSSKEGALIPFDFDESVGGLPTNNILSQEEPFFLISVVQFSLNSLEYQKDFDFFSPFAPNRPKSKVWRGFQKRKRIILTQKGLFDWRNYLKVILFKAEWKNWEAIFSVNFEDTWFFLENFQETSREFWRYFKTICFWNLYGEKLFKNCEEILVKDFLFIFPK